MMNDRVDVVLIYIRPCSTWSSKEEKLRLIKTEIEVIHQVALVVKNPPASAGDIKPWVGYLVRKIPWRRAWQPTPVFLPGESYGQRTEEGCKSMGLKRVGHD